MAARLSEFTNEFPTIRRTLTKEIVVPQLSFVFGSVCLALLVLLGWSGSVLPEGNLGLIFIGLLIALLPGFQLRSSKLLLVSGVLIRAPSALLVTLILYETDLGVKADFIVAILVLGAFVDACFTLGADTKTFLSALHPAGIGLVALTFFPFWAGPILEIFPEQASLVNWIINASPMTYLSVALDTDIYRYQMLYQTTPIGGLRYIYLDWSVYLLAYSAVTTAILFPLRLSLFRN